MVVALRFNVSLMLLLPWPSRSTASSRRGLYNGCIFLGVAPPFGERMWRVYSGTNKRPSDEAPHSTWQQQLRRLQVRCYGRKTKFWNANGPLQGAVSYKIVRILRTLQSLRRLARRRKRCRVSPSYRRVWWQWTCTCERTPCVAHADSPRSAWSRLTDTCDQTQATKCPS